MKLKSSELRGPDEVQYYDWRLTRWNMSETRERLDAAGRGIYRELLDICYGQGCFPDDPEWIMRKCACTKVQLDKAWPVIERHFPKKSGNSHRHNVFSDMWRKTYFSLCKANRNNGKLGGAKVHKKNKIDSQRLPTPTPMGIPIGNRPLYPKEVSKEVSKEEKRESGASLALVSPPSEDYHARFEVLYASHPQPGFKAEGTMRYLEILSTSVNPASAADAIDRNHAEWLELWKSRPTEFCPGMGKYFEDGWYLRKPKAREPTQGRQSATQQAMQLAKEETERNARISKSH